MNLNRKRHFDLRLCSCLCLSVPIFFFSTFGPAIHAAGITPSIIVGDATLPPSASLQTGQIDVRFGTDVPGSVDIAGFQLRIVLAGPDDAVRFTGLGALSTHPYAFAPSSAMPLFTIDPDGQGITLGDFLDSGFAQVDGSKGIASLMFEAQPSAAGNTYNVLVDVDPQQTFLAVGSTSFLAYSATNGKISLVPEPSTDLMMAIPLSALVFVARYRRQCTL